MKLRSYALAASVCALPAATAAAAVVPTTVRVEAPGGSVLPLGRVSLDTATATVTVNDTLDADTVDAPSGSAFVQLAQASASANVPFGFQSFSFGPMIQQIGADASTSAAFWRFKVNGAAAAVGASDYTLKPGDDVSWALVTDWEAPELSLTVSGDVTRVGTPVVATVRRVDNSGKTTPGSGVTVTYGAKRATTNDAGTATFAAVAGVQQLQASASPASGPVRSASLTVCAWSTATTQCPDASSNGQPADFVAPWTTIIAPRGRSTVARPRVVRGLVTRDRSRIAWVRVAIAKREGAQCQFVQPSGRLGVATSCVNRTWLTARRPSATNWVYALRRTLPLGNYQIWSRSEDTAGNRETERRTRKNLVGFIVGARR
jgi:hypothetical protein